MFHKESASNYKRTRVEPDTRAVKTLTWTYKTPSAGIKVGVISTNLEAKRKSSNTKVDGKASSIWDIKSITQLEFTDTGYGKIDQQRTRLSLAKSQTEKLLDWAPDSNGSSTTKVSLDKMFTPSSWEFPVNGFKYKDLTSVSERYGRWEFNSNILKTSRWKTVPGIRASNSKGQFYIEVSHTARTTMGMPLSGDIKGVYFADR